MTGIDEVDQPENPRRARASAYLAGLQSLRVVPPLALDRADA